MAYSLCLKAEIIYIFTIDPKKPLEFWGSLILFLFLLEAS